MSTSKNAPKSLRYSDSGVSIDTGNQLVNRIKQLVTKTHGPGVLGGLGGYAALYELPLDRYKNPVLVSGTDGVGTKLKLASLMNRHDTVGIDLVAMCVNDIVVCGAEPLYFLDYFATGKLEVGQAESVISGIAKGCTLAGCALTGGETAEMPGMYAAGDYDLAGFAVGIVEKSRILDPSGVNAGDVLLGLKSSGPHSNGYSLIRKVLEVSGEDLTQPFDGSTLGERLLEPTRIYVKSLLSVLNQVPVSAVCHVTGGGVIENLPRVLPEGTVAEIHRSSWPTPPIFDWLRAFGNIEEKEMLRTFNCGIGLIVAVSPQQAATATALFEQAGEIVYTLGEICSAPGQPEVIMLD